MNLDRFRRIVLINELALSVGCIFPLQLQSKQTIRLQTRAEHVRPTSFLVGGFHQFLLCMFYHTPRLCWPVADWPEQTITFLRFGQVLVGHVLCFGPRFISTIGTICILMRKTTFYYQQNGLSVYAISILCKEKRGIIFVWLMSISPTEIKCHTQDINKE